MKYEITYDMAVELLHRYLEKIYTLDQHKGTSVVKLQRLFSMNHELKGLLDQIRESGHNVDELVRHIKQRLEGKYMYEKIMVYVDGAARGNDNTEVENQSAIGFAIYGDSQLLAEHAIYLGGSVKLPRLRNERSDSPIETIDATNNVAEYVALIESLEYMLHEQLNAKHVEIFSDSSLVVNQVNMINTTKAVHLIRLRNCARELMGNFPNLTLTHIHREENAYVDALVNKILDEEISKQKVAVD